MQRDKQGKVTSIMKKKKAKKGKPQAYGENGAVFYDVYVMTKREWLMYVALAGIALAAAGWVFYQNVILSAVLACGGILFPKYQTKVLIKKRKRQLTLQFKDMLYSLSSAVSSGSSVERGFTLALEDMRNQYVDPKTYIIRELELIESRLSLNQNIEEILRDLGVRSGIEDIVTFASIFEISKRTGGNIVDIIRQTTDVISDKIEVEAEMETMLSGKKMEQKVLTAVPIVLLLLLTKTTGDFMYPVFHTLGGRVVSTIALCMIAAGSIWSRKITDIQI